MARMRYNHNSFSIGVLSKKVQGNTEFEGYNNALDECVNFQIQQTGGLFKRGGTHFMGEIKESEVSEGEAILVLFSYSAEDQYILEFGDKYIRFFSKYGRVLDSNNEILEVETPFSIDEVKKMKTFQEGNSLNLVTNQGIFILTRESVNEFKLSDKLEYTSEPLTFMNHEKIALKPDKDSGTTESPITFVAVNPKKIDEKPDEYFAPLFFESDISHSLVLTYKILNSISGIYEDKQFYLDILDVLDDGETGFKKITAIINIDRTSDQQNKLPTLDPVIKWQLGAFTEDRGMPQAAAMYEGRLFLANNKSYQTGIWGSSKLYNDWSDFFLSANDADGLQFKMNALHADEILWLVSQSKLFAGTRWGIYIAGAATFNDEAITPSNFRLALFEATGASSLQPVTALDSVFFVDVSGRNVYEIHLSAENGTYEASDISLLSNDLTLSGIVSHTWQQTPIKTYWCAVEDGYLCSLTYLKSNGVMAWAKHEIAGKNVKVENICSMHGDKNDYIWMIVRREINGEFKRYIEYLSPSYDPMTQEEFKQFYVDSGVSKSLKYEVSAIVRGRSPQIKFKISDDFSIDLFENILNKENRNILMCFDVQESNSPLDNHIQFKGKDWNIDKTQRTVNFRLYDSQGYKLDAHDWENMSPSGDSLFSVCYGTGKFVAVAYNSNKVVYSTDGITWTAATLPSSANWRSVCYGNGKFVAVADSSDKAAYSTDGINWAESELPSSANWYSVCYGNGKFVAVVFNSNKVAYSTDGINWAESSTLPSNADWYFVYYGDGKFVAVATGSDKAAYSTDGITWTAATLPSSAYWESVCYGDGKFVAVVYDSNKAAYSTDGITWTAATLPDVSAEWESVCYGNGKFVAVAYNSNKVAYSTDGINWAESSTLSSSDSWFSVCYGDGKFVAVADTTKAAYSTDGINWTAATLPTGFPYTGAMYLLISEIFKIEQYLNHWRIYCDTQFTKELYKVFVFLDGVDKGEYEIELATADYVVLKNFDISIDDFKGSGKIFLKIPCSKEEISEKPINTSVIVTEALPENYSGDVYINKVRGTIQLNQNRFGVLRLGSDRKTIELKNLIENAPLNGENFSPFDYVNKRGNVYLYFSEVEGLEHLSGQEVALCVDGNSTSNVTVNSNGKISLEQPAMYCSVGLPFTASARTTPFSGGSLIGSSVGEVGSQKSMWLHLYYSLGGKYGSEPSRIYDIPYTNFISGFNKTKNLISGLVKCPIISSHDVYDRSIYIEHSEPLSFNILSITQDIIVSDG